jgi:hypothetical protein
MSCHGMAWHGIAWHVTIFSCVYVLEWRVFINILLFQSTLIFTVSIHDVLRSLCVCLNSSVCVC